jgi:hypothetical protein
MDKIFFAFPEEIQKASSFLRSKWLEPPKRDWVSLFHPERVKTINPKNPVDPVKSNFFIWNELLA